MPIHVTRYTWHATRNQAKRAGRRMLDRVFPYDTRFVCVGFQVVRGPDILPAHRWELRLHVEEAGTFDHLLDMVLCVD